MKRQFQKRKHFFLGLCSFRFRISRGRAVSQDPFCKYMRFECGEVFFFRGGLCSQPISEKVWHWFAFSFLLLFFLFLLLLTLYNLTSFLSLEGTHEPQKYSRKIFCSALVCAVSSFSISLFSFTSIPGDIQKRAKQTLLCPLRAFFFWWFSSVA